MAGTKRPIISKLMLICLLIALLLAGGVFYLYKNRTKASTIQPPVSIQAVNNNENDKIIFSSVPILMYHYIRESNDPEDEAGVSLSVSPEKFDQQMAYLEANNYQTISFSQMIKGYRENSKILKDKKPIIITFDDGYSDAYNNAYPILKKHNFIGVFYIITGQIGRYERVTEEQIRELDSNGMITGGHTKSHFELDGLDSDLITSQLLDSKQMLESIVGHPIYDFCYPAGKYNDNVISILKSSGYHSAVTTKRGLSNNQSDLYQLPRIRVQNSTNLENAF